MYKNYTFVCKAGHEMRGRISKMQECEFSPYLYSFTAGKIDIDFKLVEV